MDKLIDAAKWIKTAEPGTMAYARQQTAVDGPWTTGFLIRERQWRVKGLGRNPDVELRCCAFEQDGVLLVAVLMKVSGELYESWFNYYQTTGGEPYFHDLIEQPTVTFAFFTPEPTRMLSIKNRVGGFFQQTLERTRQMEPWSMRDFDAAREKVYARYPTVSKLWKAAR